MHIPTRALPAPPPPPPPRSLLGASVDDDDYFELMIRNAWHISGGEGWCANTTCKRVLVVHSDGSQVGLMRRGRLEACEL